MPKTEKTAEKTAAPAETAKKTRKPRAKGTYVLVGADGKSYVRADQFTKVRVPSFVGSSDANIAAWLNQGAPAVPSSFVPPSEDFMGDEAEGKAGLQLAA